MSSIIKMINRNIPTRIRSNESIIHLIGPCIYLLLKFDKEFDNSLNKAVRACDCNLKNLKKDIILEMLRSWTMPDEYAKLEFYNINLEDRRNYITDHYLIDLLKEKEGNNVLPNNKYKRYLMFCEFFKRTVLLITFPPTEGLINEFYQFISQYDTFFVKPLMGTKGHGVLKLNSNEISNVEILYSIVEEDCMVEEPIIQGEELAAIHPSSINTIRFVSGMSMNNRYSPLFALLRAGQGGSVVDNVGSGGLVALIDLETGKVCSDAIVGSQVFKTHPDTGVGFKGIQIPKWGDLCTLAKSIHCKYPSQRVFGFDFAWSIKGWDLVEVNPAPSFNSYQALTHLGGRSLLKEHDLI